MAANIACFGDELVEKFIATEMHIDNIVNKMHSYMNTYTSHTGNNQQSSTAWNIRFSLHQMQIKMNFQSRKLWPSQYILL